MPSIDDLANLGVDRGLAVRDRVTVNQFRVPGYHAVPFTVDGHRIVPRPPGGRMEPIMFTVKARVAGLGRELEVCEVTAALGNQEVTKNSKGHMLSLAAILAEGASRGLLPDKADSAGTAAVALSLTAVLD